MKSWFDSTSNVQFANFETHFVKCSVIWLKFQKFCQSFVICSTLKRFNRFTEKLKCLLENLIWPSNIRNFVHFEMSALYDSTFEMFNRLLRFLKRLYFTVVKCFVRKLIWPSNFRNFDILKCLLYDSTFEMFNRLIASCKRLYFTVLQCFDEKVDLTIKYQEILTFWNVCYKAQVWRCSIAFLRHETLYFTVVKCLSENLIWPSNIRNFAILKCLLYDSITFEMFNRLLTSCEVNVC